MGDRATLALACNLGPEIVAIEPVCGDFLFATSDVAQRSGSGGRLEPYSTLALMAPR
jgi:hypothetical protein